MFLTFETAESRAAFLEQLRREHPAVADKLHIAKTQPVLVGRGLTGEEATLLRQRAGAVAKIHADIQFEPMI